MRASVSTTSNTRREHMASGGKRKTTMAKITRESRLRERRMDKKAKKDARKQAVADGANPLEPTPLEDESAESPEPESNSM
jgi:hypothetical protein